MTEFDDVEILLVEDNAYDAEMTMRALRKSNFVNQMHWVKDGVEALDFIRCTGDYIDREPHNMLKLVLLDLKTPRLNGLDVTRALKSDSKTQKIPIVVMTSSSEDRDIAECYRLGVNGYVTKPVQFQAFSEAVARIGFYWLMINAGPSA